MERIFKSNKKIVCGTEYRHVTKSIHLTLPAFLNPCTFHHYMYSKKDIETTLYSFSAYELYRLAIGLHIKVSKGMTKISYSEPNRLIYNSKAVLIHKITSQMHNGTSNSGPSCLLKSHSEHIPLLPVMHIPLCMYNSIATEGKHFPFCKIVSIRDRLYTMYKKHEMDLLMVRVIDKELFLETQVGGFTSIFQRGHEVISNGKEYIALEECTFVKPLLEHS